MLGWVLLLLVGCNSGPVAPVITTPPPALLPTVAARLPATATAPLPTPTASPVPLRLADLTALPTTAEAQIEYLVPTSPPTPIILATVTPRVPTPSPVP